MGFLTSWRFSARSTSPSLPSPEQTSRFRYFKLPLGELIIRKHKPKLSRNWSGPSLAQYKCRKDPVGCADGTSMTTCIWCEHVTSGTLLQPRIKHNLEYDIDPANTPRLVLIGLQQCQESLQASTKPGQSRLWVNRPTSYHTCLIRTIKSASGICRPAEIAVHHGICRPSP